MNVPRTADLDALYRAFPPVSAWQRAHVQESRWQEAVERSRALIARTDTAALSRAFDLLVRAVAIDDVLVELLAAGDGDIAAIGGVGRGSVEELRRGQEAEAAYAAYSAGYRQVADAALGVDRISEAWIQSLHATLCAAQPTYRAPTPDGPVARTLAKGEYKSEPNHVRLDDGTYKAHAPVAAVAGEMRRLVDELNGPAFAAAHPVVQAAYAHFALVVIHPFADGNGRVARGLASVFLYRTLRVPFVVLFDRRAAYVDAAVRARTENYDAFVSFTLDTAALGVAAMAEALALRMPTHDLGGTRGDRAGVDTH